MGCVAALFGEFNKNTLKKCGHILSLAPLKKQISWNFHIGYFSNKTVDFTQFLPKILSKITEKTGNSLSYHIFSSNQFFSNFFI